MTLDAEQTVALRNLARKAAGEDVDWINISAARALTATGLAERDRQGWRITAAGTATLQAASEGVAQSARPSSPIQMVR